MKHLRLTITPAEGTVHPVFDLVARSEFVTGAELVHWNVRDVTRPVVLFRLAGDRERFADELATTDRVRAYDLTRVDDERFYLHLRPEPTEILRAMLAAFTHDSLVVVPPITYDEGSASTTVVGSPADLQAAIENAPDGLRMEVDAVGSYDREPDDPTAALSDRQREALAAGLALGYYNSPRRATHEDVAAELGCAPSTASEHLQKAEAKLVRATIRPANDRD